jgi:hypothetical protein
LADDLVEDRDGRVGIDVVRDDIGEGLTGVLVDDVQDLQGPALRGHFELVVERPHVIWPLCVEPISRVVEIPSRRRLRRFTGTRRPYSRHNRWTSLRLQTRPSRTNTACARRYPHRGCARANARTCVRPNILGNGLSSQVDLSNGVRPEVVGATSRPIARSSEWSRWRGDNQDVDAFAGRLGNGYSRSDRV